MKSRIVQRKIPMVQCALSLAGAFLVLYFVFATSAQTTLFSDNFQDGDQAGWSKSGGTWTVVTDGSLVFRQSGTSADSRARAGSLTWTDYSVQARVKPIAFGGAGRYVALLARAENVNHFYYLALQNGNLLVLAKRDGGTSTTLASKTFTVTTGTFYTLRIDVRGSSLTAFVNGVSQLTATDSQFPAGNVGGATFFASGSFDDFVVTSLSGVVTPPAAPTGLAAVAGNGQVSLSWNPSSGASTYSVKRATVSGGPYATIATGVTSTSFTNTGLANGTTFFYVVSAVNSAGESPNSTQATATPTAGVTIPAAPTGLTATAGNGQVALAWTASAGATNYNIKRSTVSGGPYTNVGTTTSTSFTNSGLTNGTTFFYVVSAVNSAGESPNSLQASATPTAGVTIPAAPTGLTATAGNGQVALSWNATSGATSYNIKRSTVSGGPFNTVVASVSGTSFTNTGLANGTTFFFVVSAQNSAGQGPNSAQVSATPFPPVDSGDIFVAPNGTDSNSGTVDQPTTLASAVTRIAAGRTIFMRGGTYNYSTTVTVVRGNNGTSSQPKNIFAFANESPVVNFSAQAFASANRGIQLNGNFWHLRGLEIINAGDNGLFIGGNNNTIELCVTDHNRDSGLQLGRHSSSAPSSEWPANNLILNCTSFDNFDPDNGEDADGFACKLTTGPGNVFRGCIAHNNIDDGWDLFTKTDTGPISPVTIENCVSYNNGFLSTGGTTTDSDGNGFKLGGDDIAVNHTIRRCIAFGNKKHGITFNSNPGSITVTNNTSWGNAESNIKFDTGTHVFTNNLSFDGGQSDKHSGSDVSNTNCWWINDASTNGKGLVVSAADFISLTVNVSRNSDGSINLGNFLRLASGSDLINAGTPSGTDIGAIESQ